MIWTGRSSDVEQPAQAIRIMEQEVRALVAGEATRKAERQTFGVEDLGGPCDIIRRGPALAELPREALTRIPHEVAAFLRPQRP